MDYIGEVGYFELYFDQGLYEPPKSVVQFEKRVYAEMMLKNYGKNVNANTVRIE